MRHSSALLWACSCCWGLGESPRLSLISSWQFSAHLFRRSCMSTLQVSIQEHSLTLHSNTLAIHMLQNINNRDIDVIQARMSGSLAIRSLHCRFCLEHPTPVSCSSPDTSASFRASFLGLYSTLRNTETLSLADYVYILVQPSQALCPIPSQSSRRPFFNHVVGGAI